MFFTSPVDRRCTALILAAVVSATFLVCVGASAEDVVIGVLDGTQRLTTTDIKKGFKSNEKNYITSCDEFDTYQDNYVLTVEMGEFSDHLIPKQGVTVCDLLSSKTQENYLYAPEDPRDAKWDGYTIPITPSQYEEALGGSAVDFVGGGRNTLSFWGDDGSVNHTGGCCALQPHQPAAWYRPYRLLLTPKEPAMYLAWGVVPVAAVTNGAVVFVVNVWNMRSEPFEKEVKFHITINDKVVDVTSPSGQYVHRADPPEANAEKQLITVDLVDPVTTVNTLQLTAEVPVVGDLPWDVKPFDGNMAMDLVHFAAEGSAISPVSEKLALEEDWFAASFSGGESHIRPIAGHFNTAQVASLPSVEAMWTNVTSVDGVFQSKVPCESVQFYAVAVYSEVEQRIVVKYGYDDAAVVYFAGKRFVSKYSQGAHEGSFNIEVTKGYHQVLVKLYSGSNASTSSEDCSVESTFWMRVTGTAVGYTHAIMPELPEGAYELWSNSYMFYLLHLGKERTEFLYGGLDEDFINVSEAVPKPEDEVQGKVWHMLVFYGGRIPVSAEHLPKDKEAAVSYVSFAIYSDYDEPVPVRWTFVTGGKTDFYVDGVAVYSRGNDAGNLNESFHTHLSRGWHVLIVRAAATRRRVWSLTYYIHFDNHRLGGAPTPGTSLPFQLSPVRPGAPILTMMELIEDESLEGAIPFDIANKTPQEKSYSDIPIGGPDAAFDLLSVHTIWVMGKEQRQYRWVAGTSTTGVWGRRTFGGNFNQYRSLALYATEQMEITVSAVFHGVLTVWVDGKMVNPSSESSPGTDVYVLSVQPGWHQLLTKLKADDSFRLVDTENGRTTWTKANALCAEVNSMQLCPVSAVCPFGLGRPGVIPVAGNLSFAPVKDAWNEWVVVSSGSDKNSKVCQTWQASHDDMAGPPWGETEEDTPERRFVPCCGGSPPPSLRLSITPSSTAKGELGYTYGYPLIEAPVVSVNDPKFLTQTVTMTSATEGAVITYKLANSSSSQTYEGPFNITTNATIVATASLGTRTSQETHVSIQIPSVVVVDRGACVANMGCPFVVTGVDQGWRMALLRLNLDEKELTAYRNETYALQQEPSSKFSGVLTIGEGNRVDVPPLSSGVYDVILYNNTDDLAKLAVNLPVYGDVMLGPSEVVGTSETVFSIQHGVVEGDIVLLPSSSPAECGPDMCLKEFINSTRIPASLGSGEELHFKMDFDGYEGTLDCLCLCLSCSFIASPQVGIDIGTHSVVSQKVSVRVLRSSTTTTEDIINDVQPTIVRHDTLVQLIGKLDYKKNYGVTLSPAATLEYNQTVSPTCAVQTIENDKLTCKMQVRAGVMGTWTVSVTHGETSVPFAEATQRTLQVEPPDPSIESVTGSCATASASCIAGAELVFHGANFNPVGPMYNRVVVGGSSARSLIECQVTIVKETELSCKLGLSEDKEHGEFPLSIQVLVSESHWSPAQKAGMLVLGGGAGVPGWVSNHLPQQGSGGGDGHEHRWEATTIGIALGIVLVLVILGIVAIYFRSRWNAAKRETQEIDVVETGLGNVNQGTSHTMGKPYRI